MTVGRKAFTGTLWTLVESTGGQVMSFVLFLVFARLVEPRAIGMVQVTVTMLAFLTIFVEHGFTTTIIRNKEVEPVELDTAFWLSVAGGTAIAVALTASAALLAAAYRTPELTPIIRTMAWCLPITTLSVVQTALLFRDLAFRKQAMRRLIAVAAGGVVGIVLAVLGYGVWALVARFACETAIDGVAAWWWGGWRPRLAASAEQARVFFAFGSRVVGAYVISFLNHRVDDVVVGLVLGPVVLGFFAVASRGVVLVSEVAVRAAQRTALPIFSRLQEDPEALRSAYCRSVEYAVALATPIFVGMTAVASELCVTAFGAKWAPVVPAMQILGLSGTAIAMTAFTGPLLIATGRANWLFYSSIVEAVLSVATSVAAAHFGLAAVAVAFVVRSYLLVPVSLFLSKQAVSVGAMDLLTIAARPTAAALAMAWCVAALRHLCAGAPPPVRLVLLSVSGAAIYLSAMSVIARPTMGRLVGLVRSLRAAPLPSVTERAQ